MITATIDTLDTIDGALAQGVDCGLRCQRDDRGRPVAGARLPKARPRCGGKRFTQSRNEISSARLPQVRQGECGS